MPDVKSIALGGGSFVQWDDRKVRAHRLEVPVGLLELHVSVVFIELCPGGPHQCWVPTHL